MKWKPRKKSSGDVVDLRGDSDSGSSRSSSGLSMPGGTIGGIGGTAGLIITLVVIGIQVFGGGSVGGSGGGFDLGQVLSPGATAPGADNPQPLPPSQDPQRELTEFTEYVFDDTQAMWEKSFANDGEDYERARLALFDVEVSTDGCGSATSSVGPFYCPADSTVYLDQTFYEDMERQLGGGGDFAWAYVIAHEMGHHVQNVLGLGGSGGDNDLSVRTELQADCYAGVWAATVFAEGDLESGDLDEAFDTAEAIGDDRLQEQAGQSVNPDSFTHGSSEQRREWFERGYSSGDPSECDTFSPGSV